METALNWDAMWDLRRLDFERIAQEVRSRVPMLESSVSRGPASPAIRFISNVEFGFAARYNATPWGIELLIQLECGQVDRMGLRREDGSKLAFAGMSGRDAFKCEVLRGTGELVTCVPPILLPPDQASVEYQRAADEFVATSIRFCNEHIGLIVEQLRASG
jgi:hypothetical protein